MGKMTDRNLEIIIAAREVMAGYGYKKVSIDDIARKLNMTRSALYYYYRNKEEIFRAVISYEMEGL